MGDQRVRNSLANAQHATELLQPKILIISNYYRIQVTSCVVFGFGLVVCILDASCRADVGLRDV